MNEALNENPGEHFTPRDVVTMSRPYVMLRLVSTEFSTAPES